MFVSMVPKENIGADLINVCVKYLRKVEDYAHGRFLAEDLIAQCFRGESNLLIAFDEDGKIYGCVIFSIIPYDRKTVLRIVALAGEKLSLWKKNMYELIENIGKGEGCDGQEWVGRPAWVKLFPDMVPTGILMEKDY